MQSTIAFRSGEEKALAKEFLQLNSWQDLEFEVTNLEDAMVLSGLVADNILAIHFADLGAQGDAGAVKILYHSPAGIQVMHGNYAYGHLNLDILIQKLPMLRALDNRRQASPPYPFGGRLRVPEDWEYMYIGALNHFFIRKDFYNKTRTFIEMFQNHGGQKWQIFAALAWFCGARLL